MKRYEEYKDSGIEWVKAVPEHWEIIPLKRFVTINREVLSEATPPDFDFLYVDIGNVDEKGIIAVPERVRFEQAPSRARRIIKQGDTIISTVRTYLKAIAFIKDQAHDLIASTGFAVLSPYGKTLPKYIFYLVQSHTFINQVSANSYGVNYPAITPGQLGNLKIAITRERKEQEAIVAFLDHKLADIDRFIANKERLIALLKEQKAAIINQAVTKGIDQDVPMKHSGIEWLGEIPAHWDVKRAKYFFQEVDERSETGTEELLSVSHITGVSPRSEKKVFMFLAESYEGYKTCQPGDLVINIMWSWMGAAGVSNYRGIISSSYAVYRQIRNVFDWQYLDYLVRTKAYIAEFTCHSTGVHTSRLRMYTEDFFNVLIIKPPVKEQERIIQHINNKLAELDLGISRMEREIELIKEFRTTLISDVVTGKIDVRTAIREEAPV